MLNIHPSLLPSFPGLDPHGKRCAGVKVSGATVHFVVPETDAGPIVAQAAVPVLADDDVETLAAACSRPSIGSTRWRSLWSRPHARQDRGGALPARGHRPGRGHPADAREQMTEKQNPRREAGGCREKLAGR